MKLQNMMVCIWDPNNWHIIDDVCEAYLTFSWVIVSVGKWAVEPLKENKVPGDKGLVLKSRAKHHAIAAMLNKPFVFKDDPLVIQWV